MATALFQYRRENALDLPPMRKWQERCVPQIREAIRQGHKRIVVQSPTGAGKTLLAAHLFAGSIAKGKRPMFTVPDITLVEQTLHSFERVGIHDVGVIQAQHERTDRDAQVQIASISTLIRRDIPDVDLIVIDEAHVSYDALYKLMAGPVWTDKIVIGLSATPWARGMGLHWTKLIIGATINELIADKILCGFTAFGPKEEVDRGAVHVVKGEFDEEESSAIMREGRIVADVVKTWQERWGKDRTFMFCVNRAHAREQQAKFEEAGVPFGYIDGTMSIDERKPVFRQFRDGSIKGIASVGCLSRGVDEDVRYIIDAQLTKSEMNLVQKCGRGLRNNGPDKHLLIADHAGNMMDLGVFSDIFHDELDSRVPGDRTKPPSGNTAGKKPHKCPACNSIVSYASAKCTVCGTVLRSTSRVTHADGELVEYSSDGMKREKPAENKQAWFSGFLHIAMARGHSQGWAAHRYRARFGVWPNGLRKEAAVPTLEMRKYDQHLRIKYIRGKQKEESRGKQAESDMPVL